MKGFLDLALLMAVYQNADEHTSIIIDKIGILTKELYTIELKINGLNKFNPFYRHKQRRLFIKKLQIENELIALEND